MSRKGKRWKKIFLIAACVIIEVFLINQITVYPFIWIFRDTMSLLTQQGNPGDYVDVIAKVEKTACVSVPVNGYSDAAFTVYRPQDTQDRLPVIIYIHGGGWSLGNAAGVSWFAKLLASNGYVVCNVDYALAPEYPFPASTCQLAEVIQFIYEHAKDYGIDRNNIFLGGNSAGEHLSSQLGALFTDSVYAKHFDIELRIPGEAIRGLLLFNGVYNFDKAGDCGFFAFGKWAWSYTGEKNYHSYDRLDEMSSVKHITVQYPATFITVGDADPLEPQTKEFVEELIRNGVDHTALFWTDTGTGLEHDYIYMMNTPQAQKAYETAVTFLAQHLDKSDE